MKRNINNELMVELPNEMIESSLTTSYSSSCGGVAILNLPALSWVSMRYKAMALRSVITRPVGVMSCGDLPRG